eukprot:3552681-Rhodomonas_salina.1
MSRGVNGQKQNTARAACSPERKTRSTELRVREEGRLKRAKKKSALVADRGESCGMDCGKKVQKMQGFVLGRLGPLRANLRANQNQYPGYPGTLVPG